MVRLAKHKATSVPRFRTSAFLSLQKFGFMDNVSLEFVTDFAQLR